MAPQFCSLPTFDVIIPLDRCRSALVKLRLSIASTHEYAHEHGITMHCLYEQKDCSVIPMVGQAPSQQQEAAFLTTMFFCRVGP